MNDEPRPKRRWTTAVAAAALTVTALGSAACSNSKAAAGDHPTSDHRASTTSTSTSTSTSTAEATAVAANPPAAGPQKLTIEGLDYSYKISGAPHAGLVEIDFDNQGKYAHEVGLARVKPGVTLARVKAGLLSKAPDAEAKAKALQVDPDTEITSAAIVAGHVSEKVVVPLKAGHYIVSCFLPGPDGMPHVAMGMIGEFTVLAPAAIAPVPPATNGTIELTDTGIKTPPTLAHGGTFAVENTGKKAHDFSVARLARQPLSALFQCVGQSLGKGAPIDKCPGALQGGVTTVPPGGSAYVTLHLPTGSYGYVSTQGNGADFQAGLNGTFAIK